jgi:hypothetical protein
MLLFECGMCSTQRDATAVPHPSLQQPFIPREAPSEKENPSDPGGNYSEKRSLSRQRSGGANSLSCKTDPSPAKQPRPRLVISAFVIFISIVSLRLTIFLFDRWGMYLWVPIQTKINMMPCLPIKAIHLKINVVSVALELTASYLFYGLLLWFICSIGTQLLYSL